MDAAASPLQELLRSGHVWLVSVVTYLLLACLHSHLAAFIMLDAATDFGLSFTAFTLAIGAGNGFKFALIYAAGPAMDRCGAHNIIILTMAAGTALVAILASTNGSTTFLLAMVALIGSSAFAEQPTFVIVNATHLQLLLSLATTSITSAFSASGAFLPMVLAPVLDRFGWRRACWLVTAACVLVLPLTACVLRPGPLAVGRSHARGRNGHAPSSDSRARVAGISASEALCGRERTFWVLFGAMLMHMTYGATITNHLLTALQTDARLSVVSAGHIMSLQFAFAVFGKLLTGATLALPAPPRTLLFVVGPLVYCGSHLLLLETDWTALLSAVGTGQFDGVRLTKDVTRLQLYGIAVGWGFGVVFGLIQCLPVRLFGRRDLPTLQSLMYSSVLLGNTVFIPVMGYLRDTFSTYAVPFLVTLTASAIEVVLLHVLKLKDIESARGLVQLC